MKELINELFLICDNFNTQLGSSLSNNDELSDMKELIDHYLSGDYQKLRTGIEQFKELRECDMAAIPQESYIEAYHNLLSGLAEMSGYLDDFHNIVFNLNQKRRYRLGEINEEEYNKIINQDK